MQHKEKSREEQILESLETASMLAKKLKIEDKFSEKIKRLREDAIQASKVAGGKKEALGLIYNSVQALLDDLLSREDKKDIRSLLSVILSLVLLMSFGYLLLAFYAWFFRLGIPLNLRNFLSMISLNVLALLIYIGIFTLYSYIFMMIFRNYLNHAQRGLQARYRVLGVGLLYLFFLINIFGYVFEPIFVFFNDKLMSEGNTFFDSILAGIGTFNPISIATDIPIIIFYYTITVYIFKAYIYIWTKFIFRDSEI
jgi:hypothetical protein